MVLQVGNRAEIVIAIIIGLRFQRNFMPTSGVLVAVAVGVPLAEIGAAGVD